MNEAFFKHAMLCIKHITKDSARMVGFSDDELKNLSVYDTWLWCKKNGIKTAGNK